MDKDKPFGLSVRSRKEDRWKLETHVATGVAVLTLIYLSIVQYFSNSQSILGLPPPEASLCSDKDKDDDTTTTTTVVCSRSDLFAYQLMSGSIFVYCSLLGIRGWYIINSKALSSQQSPGHLPEGRVFAYVPAGYHLAVANLIFQVWDFVLSPFIPEHRSVIFMVHHFLAASVGYVGLRFQLLHYYSFYYFGLSEISSIFLVWIGLSNYFPYDPNDDTSLYKQFVMIVCGPAFSIFFAVYRVILWWPTSIRLIKDCFHVMRTRKLIQFRGPQKEWTMYLFSTINLLLGTLQLYWLRFVIEGLWKNYFS